jgi:EAL domain-containing protein (putative c-di-GMP-specific phosphodiesterase class I)
VRAEDSLTLQQLDLLGCRAVQGYLINWLEQQQAAANRQTPR